MMNALNDYIFFFCWLLAFVLFFFFFSLSLLLHPRNVTLSPLLASHKPSAILICAQRTEKKNSHMRECTEKDKKVESSCCTMDEDGEVPKTGKKEGKGRYRSFVRDRVLMERKDSK